jgi:hypothetical protein
MQQFIHIMLLMMDRGTIEQDLLCMYSNSLHLRLCIESKIVLMQLIPLNYPKSSQLNLFFLYCQNNTDYFLHVFSNPSTSSRALIC